LHIILLCATERGLKFLERLRTLCPDDRITVFTFNEEPWEPRFVEKIRAVGERERMEVFVNKNVMARDCEGVWNDSIDLVFIVHWRYILAMRAVGKVGLATVVLHDSLLPAYRGFSQTVWAMIVGEQRCGVSMCHLSESMDAGDLIDQVEVAIGPDETIAEVMEKSTFGYLTLLERNIELLKRGLAPRRAQDRSLATYTCRRLPSDNLIDWRQPTRSIFNVIRATSHPYPGAYTFYQGKRMRIWMAERESVTRRYVGAIPGRVVEIFDRKGIAVLTGDGTLLVRTIQMEQESEVCAADVIRSISAQLG
jgi:methionyl-tRNA formyltransferase